MNEQYLTYQTVHGDRWDTVSYKMYGDVEHITQLVGDNAFLPYYRIFPQGTSLNVRVQNAVKEASTIKAPWD